MDIYFSGSIRGGRQDTDLYNKLIKEISRYGNVLTEHVGDDDIDHNISDKEIHAQDIKWLQDCDIVIAEVTTPSLGVGYELGRAVVMGKKTIALYQKKNQENVSAMIFGASKIECYGYSSFYEAKNIVDSIFT